MNTHRLAGNRRTGTAPVAGTPLTVSRALDEFAGHPAPYRTTQWRAWALGNYDGDTMTVRLDSGMFDTRTCDLRVYGINAPELKTGTKASRAKGIKAKQLLTALCPPGTALELVTTMDPNLDDPTEKYGRILASVTVYRPDGTTFDLGAEMLKSGLVKVYVPDALPRRTVQYIRTSR